MNEAVKTAANVSALHRRLQEINSVELMSTRDYSFTIPGCKAISHADQKVLHGRINETIAKWRSEKEREIVGQIEEVLCQSKK